METLVDIWTDMLKMSDEISDRIIALVAHAESLGLFVRPEFCDRLAEVFSTEWVPSMKSMRVPSNQMDAKFSDIDRLDDLVAIVNANKHRTDGLTIHVYESRLTFHSDHISVIDDSWCHYTAEFYAEKLNELIDDDCNRVRA